MRRFVHLGLALLASTALASTTPLAAAPPAAATPYTRLVESDDGAATLELLTRSFRRADGSGPIVDLVSAVHIADESFYRARQVELDRCDVVLFEGVRPPGTDPIAPTLDDAGKAEATGRRLDFLAAALAEIRAREGRWPASIDDLATLASPRSRTMVAGLLRDGWDRPLRLEIVPAETGDAARIVSDGADGAAGGEGPAADLAVEVAAQGSKPAVRAPNVQAQLAKALGIAFQLDQIDSSKPHWRNSDMAADALRARLKEAGAGATMILRLLDGNTIEAKVAGFLLGIIGRSEQLATIAKLALVEQLAAADPLAPLGSGRGGLRSLAALEKVIIVDRNEVVIADLAALFAAQEANRPATIAVFYGAGHMADLERRFRDELHLVPIADRWTAALRVGPVAGGMSAAEIAAMRSTLRRLLGTNRPRPGRPDGPVPPAATSPESPRSESPSAPHDH